MLNVYLQSTVSESTLVALLAARKNKILQLQAEQEEELDDSVLNSRLVVYTSDQVSVYNFMKNNFLKVEVEKGLTFSFFLCDPIGSLLS